MNLRAVFQLGVLGAIAALAVPSLSQESNVQGTTPAVADFNTCAKPEWPKEALRNDQTGTASSHGNANAAGALGNMYEAGRGVLPDLPTALEWYQKAARQGNGAALRRLGVLYEEGCGVAKDANAAFSHFSHAAAPGDQPAMQRLAAIFGAG